MLPYFSVSLWYHMLFIKRCETDSWCRATTKAEPDGSDVSLNLQRKNLSSCLGGDTHTMRSINSRVWKSCFIIATALLLQHFFWFSGFKKHRSLLSNTNLVKYVVILFYKYIIESQATRYRPEYDVLIKLKC